MLRTKHTSSLLYSYTPSTPTLLKKQFLLPKPLCHSRITAATTEGFGCYMTTKTVEHILSSL